jgi:hypothetical protein
LQHRSPPRPGIEIWRAPMRNDSNVLPAGQTRSTEGERRQGFMGLREYGLNSLTGSSSIGAVGDANPGWGRGRRRPCSRAWPSWPRLKKGGRPAQFTQAVGERVPGRPSSHTLGHGRFTAHPRHIGRRSSATAAKRAYAPAVPARGAESSAPYLLARPPPGGGSSSGGCGESCGYRWITMQVRVRVTPSTSWMRETTSRPS